MKQSYWRLTKKKKSGDTSLIVELSPDGVVYIWPEKAAALFSDLALELDQDLDALLADGDFLEYYGFFHSITDFMNHTKYSPELYEVSWLGEMESIRACRSALVAV